MAFAALDRKHTIAPAGYNRWLIPPAALAIHLCIGQVVRHQRLQDQSLVDHFDTSLTSVGIVFSIAIVMLGLSAAVLGTWVDTGRPAPRDGGRGPGLVARLPGRAPSASRPARSGCSTSGTA